MISANYFQKKVSCKWFLINLLILDYKKQDFLRS